MTDRIDFGGKPWSALPRDLLRDPNLTYRAKGGLVTLLSHEEGWVRSTIAILMREGDCGREQAQSIMRELVKAGYAERHQQNGEGGRFTTSYTVHAQPVTSTAETSDSPSTGGPATVEPSTGSPSAVVEALEVDPQDGENPKNNQKLAPTSSPRSPDLIFEALFGLETGKIYNKATAGILTPSARAALNKATAEVKSTGVDVADLMRAISAWPVVMGDATCTANAVAKHLPRLLAAADGNVARAAQPSDEEKVLAELRRRREMKEAAGG